MSRLASLPGQLVLGAAHYLARVAFGAVTVAALVAGVLYLRLAQGPIHLPWLAATATRLVNQEAERIRVDVGDVILTLGEAGNPSGIQFVDVAISDPAGTPLFAIPRLAASLYTADLLAGRIRPTRITLIKPVARIERDASGEFRFGLGSGAGVAPDTVGAAVEPSAHDSPQVAAMDRLLDQLAGDAEPLPSLTRLRELSIVDADLTYSNGATGRQWRTRQADLKVQRLATGLKAQLSIGLEDGAISGAEVAIDAERRRGTGGIVDVSARFRNLRPEHLAEELDAMQWLALFEAPVNGAIRLRVHPSGAIDDLSGRIGAGPGRLLAAGSEGRPFERLSVDFAYQTGLDRMQISRLSLASPALAAELSGIVDLGRNPARDLTGLAGQFEVASLHIAVPEVFAEPLDFDGGQVVARLDMSPVRIELAEAHLRNGPLVFDVSGRARADAEGWHTELRASGRHLTVAQLLQHWPLAAAKGAREWVRNNIRSGDIDEAIALMRFGGGEPVLNLDFAFTDLESGYLRDMTPIRHARGRGSLTLGTFDLAVDSGDVEPLAGAQLRIDGSVVHMPNIDEKPALADIMLRVSGRSDGVLALIDEPPLGFTRKLGLDPATVGGQAEVTTRLSFPLLKDLTMNEVRVDSHALLTALRLPFSLRGSPPVDVKGAGPVDLRATAEAMRLTGPLSVEGVPLALDWTESYGLGRNYRDVALEGPVTPALLDRLGIAITGFEGGSLPVKLNLAQKGTEAYELALRGDLGPARIAVDPLGWEKPEGVAGQVEAAGSIDSGVKLSSFHLDTNELEAAGALELAPGGSLQSAKFERFRYRDFADLTARVTAGPDGTMAARIGGNLLDLAVLDSLPSEKAGDAGGAAAPRQPWNLEFRIDAVKLRPDLVARPGTGTVRRDADGGIAVHLGGQAEGSVPFVVEYREPPGKPGDLVLNSTDAGGLLRTAGLFQGAQGGRLDLTAAVARGDGLAVTGEARISDVTVRNATTFTTILDEGGVSRAADAAESGGLHFSEVRVPFDFRDGLLTLDTSTAKGNLLAVSVEGTVDRNSDSIDLVGVISPAYGVTGVLDSIPVLGSILSGGQGEGILAMTFAVKGPAEDPKFTVNPLSLLTPGILRKVFSGRTNPPDERFLNQLRPNND